jgi:hypothetical protein
MADGLSADRAADAAGTLAGPSTVGERGWAEEPAAASGSAENMDVRPPAKVKRLNPILASLQHLYNYHRPETLQPSSSNNDQHRPPPVPLVLNPDRE